MRLGVVLCLVVGCGGSAKPRAAAPADPQRAERDAAREAAAAREAEIEAMRPASPFEVRERAVYRPAERCGQGPYRIELDALRARYGERLVVYACGERAIRGNYRITQSRKGQPPDSREASFGFRRENEACKAREGAVVSGVAGEAGAGRAAPAGGGRGRAGGAAAAAAPSKIEPVALERGAGVPERCVRSSVLDSSWLAWADSVALDARLVIDLWSDEPNDLAGLVFVVEQSAVVADMTLERWRAYEAARDAWYAAYRAHLDGEVRAGRTTLVDTTVTAPPPPPPRAEVPPPRPSQNARWIPGYWHHEAAKFHWIPGLWDVPEEDVRRALTVQAPTPPPAAPARDAPTEPPPARAAVWTPGSWQWNGSAYVWVAGAWRIPPDAGATWQRATWTVRGGRATFVPGGWRVRVRLGR